jgi:hypothetical protein
VQAQNLASWAYIVTAFCFLMAGGPPLTPLDFALIFRVAHPSDFASRKSGAVDCLRISSPFYFGSRSGVHMFLSPY